MGTKTPTSVKEKRALIPCEECPREFQNISALKSHTSAKHPEKYKQMQRSSESTGDERKTAFVPPTSRASKRLQQKKSVDKEIDSESKPSGSDVGRKTFFECPKCAKLFQVYFSALKHIQKRHCEDEDGNTVLSNSTKLIKPIRKETCTVCSKTVNGFHSCGDISYSEDFSSVDDSARDSKGTYSCLGCERNFGSVASFDRHVVLSHNGDVITMQFSSYNEFMFWKTDMESQVKIKYQQLYKTPQRQYYHCNYVSTKNSAEITHLCPSILITRQLPTGIQVDIHNQHFEHTCDYEISKEYEDFIIDKDSLFDSLKSDDDLYIKLKSILKNITLGAAKIDPKNLRKLYNLASEMQSCLSSIEQEEAMIKKKQLSIAFDVGSDSKDNNDRDAVENETTDKENTNKSMTDDQITKALEPSRVSARLKRKSQTSSPVPKKKKLDNEVKGLKENNNITKDMASPKINSSSPTTQSPSFNDSYKQFIDSSFKVSKPLILAKRRHAWATRKETSSAIKKETSSVATKESPITKKPSSPNIRKIKKDIVKTKMGQFSPKKLQTRQDNVIVKKNRESIKSPRTETIADLSLDRVEFEVFEQENDCNILVLKI